jgi:fibronectin type 3 domain-containing protein
LDALLPANSTSFKDPGLSPGASYYYQIVAYNISGNSAFASLTEDTVPPAPTGLSAAPGNGQAALTWQAASGAATYNVYRGTTAGGESATPIATGLTSAIFTDTGLNNGQVYYYKVAALDPASASPTNLSGISALSLEVSVTPSASVAGSLTGSSSSAATAVNLTSVGVADWAHWGNGSVPGFDHKASGNSQISTYTVVGTGAVTGYANDPRSLSWTDGTPTASSTNNLSGVFIAGIGNGFSITAPADLFQRTLTVYVGGWNSGGTLLAQLSDGSAANFTNTTATATGQYDEAYTLTYKATSANQKLTVTWTQASGTGNVTLDGAALTGGAQAPAAPTNLQATPGNAQVALSWTAPTGALTYNIYRGTTSGGEVRVQTGVTTTTFTDSGLSNGQVYFYQVSAVNTGGEGPKSSEVSATPNGSTTGSLSGSGSSATTAVNLTTIGTSDWAHWGSGSVPGFDHKASGNSQISAYTIVGSGTVNSYSNDPRPLTWSDGTPTASSTNNLSGVYIAGIGSGFSITAPADLTQRTLTVYVGGWNSGGTLLAQLSDSSAASFTDTTSTATGQYDRAYTLTYKAGSAGQKLTVTWTQASGTGNVTLNGAALSVPTAGSLSGSISSATTSVSLTSVGTVDWAHWGNGGVPGFDHKATGGGQISSYSLAAAGTVHSYNNDPRPLTWTDGTPTTSSTTTSSKSGVYVAGIGNGFSITAPASTNQRTLTVYVGGWNSGGKLVAHLSDGSAVDFTNTTTTASGQYDRAYTLTYTAGSAGQTLKVTWTMASGTGNVTLDGAALSGAAAGNAPLIQGASSTTSSQPGPSNLVAVTAGSGINLSWTAVTGAVSYNIYRGTTPGGEGSTPIATGVKGLSFTDKTVTKAITYYYRVTAVLGWSFAESAFSNEAFAKA